MKKKIVRFLPVLTTLISLSACTANHDYPGWRGPERDGKVTGFNVPATWPKELTKVWETSVGLGDASPVMVNNRIYLLTDRDSIERLLCLDVAGGKEIWSTAINHSPLITGGASTHPGPRSTPLVWKDRIFSMGAGGIVSCHDLETGRLIWKNENHTGEVPRFFTAASPVVCDNKCILPLGGHDHGVVVAFDVNTGSEIWKLDGIACTYSSPVLMNLGKEIIINQAETTLLGISTDGRRLWEIPTPSEQRYYNSSSPVIDGQDLYIAGAGKGTFKYQVVANGDRYACEQVWNNPDLGVSYNTPVLKDGYLYANEGRFGSIFCLNAQTGEKAWADTVKLNRFASMLDLGAVMLTLAGNAEMVIFKPDPAEFQPLARYKMSDTDIYASPILAGDKIYVKDKEKLTCWSVK